MWVIFLNVKFFKSTIILVTLFSCTLLLAQEATKSFEKIESGYSSLDNIDQDNNVIKFAEDFVQPIMRGEAYDISIGEIQLVTEYQRNNPIKCVFDSKETRDRNGCHDRVSFIEFFGRDRFDQVSDTKTVYPYSYIMKDYYIDKNNSIIIPFNISLKKEFQKKLPASLLTVSSTRK